VLVEAAVDLSRRGGTVYIKMFSDMRTVSESIKMEGYLWSGDCDP
jgi:hypothetical protein